ncbi:hypothetical protein BT69DRAFT_1278921 [Atractiella rhizophila]|nr:hypothetical protein BT69DRAFT_1278921 [Atractiella rhizophila]
MSPRPSTPSSPPPRTTSPANPLPTSNGGTTNFAAALSTWKSIDLGNLQKTLDGQGIEIVQQQKDSLVGRKKLAEATREFKKISDEEKVQAFKGLLKSYQSEIDALTTRCKFSESSFLSVYRLLAEAPDPYPLLDAAVDQTALASTSKALESQLQRVQGELATVKGENEKLKKEVKEKEKVKERLEKVQEDMERMVSERTKVKEKEVEAMWEEKMRNYEEREQSSTRQLELLKNQLIQLRSSNESTQARLLDHSERQDQETLARLAELEMVEAERVRAESRAVETERRNEQLRAELERARSGTEAKEEIASLRNQIEELQSEAGTLLSSLERMKNEKEADRRERDRAREKEEMDRRMWEDEVRNLKEKLDSHKDYDEVKRELEIMKYVEFTSLDLDSEEPEDGFPTGASEASWASSAELKLPDPNPKKAQLPDATHGNSLEGLLMLKNRRLQTDVTTLRVTHEELREEYERIKHELDDLRHVADERKKLNLKLENDLLRVNHSASPATSGDEISRSASPGITLPVNAIAARKVPDAPTPSETSILPIITSQRDRFRQRNSELEEELRKQFDIISTLRAEIKSLQSDNLKLYEKVRYLQSYREDAGPSSTTNRSGYKDKDEVGGKYGRLYEQTMNPFETFQKREQTRAVQNLNPFDKILLTFANVILGKRMRRNFFILYALGLHVFVMFTMYEAAWSSEGSRVENVPLTPPIRI